MPAATAGGAVAGTCPGWLAGGAAWVYLVGAAAATWIDLDVHRIPDYLLIRWAPVPAATVLLAAAAEGAWGILTGALTGAAVLIVLFMGLVLLGSMGMGDVKLAAVTGLVL